MLSVALWWDRLFFSQRNVGGRTFGYGYDGHGHQGQCQHTGDGRQRPDRSGRTAARQDAPRVAWLARHHDGARPGCRDDRPGQDGNAELPLSTD